MCGRYSLVVNGDFGKRFRVHIPAMGLRSRFNVAPGQVMPVICRADERRCAAMTWGFVPGYARDVAKPRRLINARAETVPKLPSFHHAFIEGRCIVPASGFFEWKAEGRRRIPFYYRLRNEDLFGFAGIYSTLPGPDGAARRTYAIITTPANSLVSAVHDRMPAILRPDDEERWLTGPADILPLDEILGPFPPESMEGYPVSERINNPGHEGEDLIRPLCGLL
ncbi:MAG: SOS response-associated peptidase [Methanomicrobiaceae archaeon]|nr:SOS response-associated peptidase [Methanomicrobiaceae archaeon]